MPVASQVWVAPTPKVGMTQISPSLSSVTVTFASATSPVLVTTYCHVTAPSTATAGPGAASASSPLVDFSISIAGLASPK